MWSLVGDRDRHRRPEDYDTEVFPTWCPGCGNFGLWGAIKRAMADLGLEPHDVFYVWGIGCHGNGADFLKVNGFHALHGRALPVATGAKLANHELSVIVEVGDGDGYGIGGNHLLHSCRRNIDVTLIGHNNQVYGLTTGQTSPTSAHRYVSPSTPSGTIEEPVNPLALALVQGATYVARGFAGDIEHLTALIRGALEHKGFALVDVFQPCITFNKLNTYAWFRERLVKLEDLGHDASDRGVALAAALGEPLERDKVDASADAAADAAAGASADASASATQGERLPIGLFYRADEPTYEQQVPALAEAPLVKQPLSGRDLDRLLAGYR